VVEDAGVVLFVVKLGVVVAAVTEVAVDLVVLVEVERVVLMLVVSGVVVWICLEMHWCIFATSVPCFTTTFLQLVSTGTSM